MARVVAGWRVAALAMVNAQEAASLITCDAPTKEVIKHLNDERVRVHHEISFIIEDLDEQHLYVKSEAVEMIRARVAEKIQEISFEADLTAAAKKK